LTHLHVIPVPRRLAPDLLVRVASTDPLDVFGAVLRACRRLVLPPLPRRVALGPEAPGIRLADHGAILVLERRAVCLLDGAAGGSGRLLDPGQQHAVSDNAIPFTDRQTPSKIRSSVHRVDAGEASDVARHDPIHREENRRRRNAMIPPEGIAIADAVSPVADGVARRGFDVWLRSA